MNILHSIKQHKQKIMVFSIFKFALGLTFLLFSQQKQTAYYGVSNIFATHFYSSHDNTISDKVQAFDFTLAFEDQEEILETSDSEAQLSSANNLNSTYLDESFIDINNAKYSAFIQYTKSAFRRSSIPLFITNHSWKSELA